MSVCVCVCVCVCMYVCMCIFTRPSERAEYDFVVDFSSKIVAI